MLKYIKNSIFNDLSLIGVFFLVIALYFAGDNYIKNYNNRKELSYREKIQCTFVTVSDIRKKHDFSKNGKTSYYQDFTIAYQYKGQDYQKDFENFYFSSKHDCYKNGSKDYVWVNKNKPTDAVISSRFVLNNTFGKQIFIMFGIPGIIIIFFPKKKSKSS